MQVDFVKAPALNPGRCNGCTHFALSESDDTCNRVNGVKLEHGTCFDESIIWVQAASTARANDPATSKGRRKVNKYEQAVLDVLAGAQHTGKEIAEVSGHPLNCITPRFAPLRRKGLIKDSGIKRDKQIVWCLV